MNSILQPLSAGFRLVLSVRQTAYHRGWFKTRRLHRPVVSVGNLTVGGTGKTPLVMLIARTLLKHGWSPGILTRGYGRRHGAELLVLGPGSDHAADARGAGDEPALLAKALPEVPVIVCADRYRAGRLAEECLGVDVHVLDDGFQHLALRRDIDVVALDVTQEFSDHALLPAGRLREPCRALKRAHLVVLTRAHLADPKPLEDQVRQINPGATIFCSTTKFCGLVEVASGKTVSLQSLQGSATGAFCGLGNPGAFFADLAGWGFRVVRKEVFPDHHVYTWDDLRRVVEKARHVGATVLLTTEKDAVNFPQFRETEIPILSCAIQAEIAEGGRFERALLALLEEAKRVG